MLIKEIRNNLGSAVIEMTLIMPVIILIIVMILFLFFDVINNAVIMGETYCGIYEISVEDDKNSIDTLISENISDKAIGNDFPYVELEALSGEIYAYVKMKENRGFNTYEYRSDSVTYKREFDKCTDRLRRWQLYGDIFWE